MQAAVVRMNLGSLETPGHENFPYCTPTVQTCTGRAVFRSGVQLLTTHRFWSNLEFTIILNDYFCFDCRYEQLPGEAEGSTM